MNYLERPIFDTQIDWSQGITRKLAYDLRTQQVGFGAEVEENLQQYTADGFELAVNLRTPCEINALERFFAAVFGRLQGFWLPSPGWQVDIVAAVSASEFLIANSGVADLFAILPALHLYLRPNGVWPGEAAAVVNVTVVDEQTERVTLAAPLTSGVPDATWVVQRLLYARLQDDEVTLNYVAEGWARAQFSVYELPVEYASVELGQRPAFAYHFWRQVGALRQDWYYTSFDRQIVAGTVQQQHACTPAPIGHDSIERTTAGNREQMEIRSWRFDGSPFAAFQPFAAQHDLFVEVWEVDLASGQPEIATTVFAGLVESVEPLGRALKVTCTTRLDRLGAKLPRFYVQTSCNYCLYDSCCKASRAAFSVVATVAAVDPAGLTLTLAGGGLTGKPADWFQFGDAEIADAEGLPEYRTVVASMAAGGGQQIIRLAAPFSRALAVGDTVTVAAGCNLQYNSANGCSKFGDTPRGNKDNFGGHPYIDKNLSLKAIPLASNGAGKGGGK